MAFVKIEHLDTKEVFFLPSPSIYTADVIDLDSMAERANGYVKRKRIRQDVWRVDYAAEALSASDIDGVVDAISPAKFRVTFFAPKKGFYHTAEMYAGNRRLELQECTNENEPENAKWKLSFPLVEY